MTGFVRITGRCIVETELVQNTRRCIVVTDLVQNTGRCIVETDLAQNTRWCIVVPSPLLSSSQAVQQQRCTALDVFWCVCQVTVAVAH